jgi:Ca2+-binding EF-hand superfamily protein
MNHYFWRKGAMLGAAAFISHMMFTSATFSPGALAQPDLNNTPKGENPPPRERPNRNNRENNLQGPEQNLRRLMTQAGIGEGATQDAILEYVRADLHARSSLREQGTKLIQALRAGAVTDDQMAALVADYRAAQQVEKSRREVAEAQLDAKISYSKNPRLEAMLLLAGVIGEGGGLMMPPGFGGGGPGRRGGQGEGQALNPQEREARRQRMLERFDVNKDGKLDAQEEAAMREQRQQQGAGQQGDGQPPTPQEREERRKRMLERFDTNKDGKLDAQEEAAMREQRQQQGAGQQGGGQQLTPQEREERRKRMLERFDTNKDGKLDAQEEAAMREQRQRQREQRQGKGDAAPAAMPQEEA